MDDRGDSGVRVIIRLQGLETLTRAGEAISRVKERYQTIRERARERGDWHTVERVNLCIGAIEECFNEVANLSENDNGG